jgi:hypothetical protein
MYASVLLVCLSLAASAAQPRDPVLLRPDSANLQLDELGLYRIGLAYRGRPEEEFPIGWSGTFDERTGVACEALGSIRGHGALLLHCPWRGGTGVAFQEYHIHLPARSRVRLSGATALREDGVGRSDGVTFRIKADGKILLDVHRSDAQWAPFEFDLTAMAGRTVVLRFECDCGPKDDASFDFGIWGDRTLRIDGFQAAPTIRPVPPPVSFRQLVSRPGGGVAPPGARTTRTNWERSGEQIVLRATDVDGSFTYTWRRSDAGERAASSMGVLGKIVLEARMNGAQNQSALVPLATTAEIRWARPAKSLDSRWEETGGGPVLVREFQVGSSVATLRARGTLFGKCLAIDLEIDEPVASSIDTGGWGPVARRRMVPVPYFTGQLNYLPIENLFVCGFIDWTASGASSLETHRAHYLPLTDGTRRKVRERVIFAAGWHLAEVLPNIPNQPSPFRGELADRIVLDVWGGRYSDIAAKLEELDRYGIRRSVVIIHDWQRSGYDNALPAHIPAAGDKGGDDTMKALVATAKRLGDLIALHENYVDYYPNYDHFHERDISLDSAGNRQNAWYNPGTKIQSFAIQPDAILRLAETQSPEIHRRYGTNACYLDVHSAVPPWFHVDQRAGMDGAGTFKRVWDVHRALWAYERTTHTGPVFGEGNNHWYWSGCLDGVEAQFGAGWPSHSGREAPLFIDFDLLKIHPLQFNHGMGYLERWWNQEKAGWGPVPPMVVLDQYRMQEVAFGHAGFLGGAVYATLPLAWLEHHLLSPVTSRYATAIPVEIVYEHKGKWLDASSIVRSDLGSDAWKRVRVRYDNGLTITANQAPETFHIDGADLPQYGWLARGAGVSAGTALRDGAITDYAETGSLLFANARPAPDWNLSGIRLIRPAVRSFRQTGPRAFAVVYSWQVDERLTRDYRCFVHFNKAGIPAPEIAFQQDHALATPTNQWRAGTRYADGPHVVNVPDSQADGDYTWSIGLYAPGENRLSLEGQDDGTNRIVLGFLHVANGGRTLKFNPQHATGSDRAAIYQEHLNKQAKLIKFGPIQTDGSVLIEREGSEWVARTYPRERPFTVLLDSRRFGRPAAIRAEKGASSQITPVFQGEWWRLRLNSAQTYRWPDG